MKQLTKKQAEILDYIRSFISTHGYAPSYRELMTAFQLASVSSIFKHIKSLQTKGFLKQHESVARSIELVTAKQTSADEHDKPNGTSVAIIGSIAKGKKFQLFPQVATAFFPTAHIKTELPCYGFLVSDHSFQDKEIRQGDLVAIEAKESAKNGEIVLATTAEAGAMIGRYAKEKKGIRIETELFQEEAVRIHGALIALIRSYDLVT
jgi:repressor LexA